MTITGSCHCGATRFELQAAPVELTRCTCTFCSKRGALWAYYAPRELQLPPPADRDAIYQWRSKTVKHHFCPVCGCGTYSESPDWSTGQADFSRPKIGVNARLLDEVDIEAIPVKVIDGRNLW